MSEDLFGVPGNLSARRVMVELLDFDGTVVCQFEMAVYSHDRAFEVLHWRGAVFVAKPITSATVQFRRVRERTIPDNIGVARASLLSTDWPKVGG